jgi:phosphatidylglycerophosphate synthase
MTDHSAQVARTASRVGRGPSRAGSPFPGAVLAAAVSMAMVHGLAAALVDPPAMAVALAVFLAGSALMLAGLPRGYPHAEFGAANVVTLVRLALVSVLVGVLAAPVAGPAAAWGVPAIATVALALDGVDGWLARRAGLVSRFGARFDMEVDCVLALTLALLVLDSGKVGAWVVALGAARYAFWAAAWAVPWLAGELPERRSRKLACVAQILVLIALTTPVLDPREAAPLAAGALMLVGWSFAVDIRHLRRARR